MYATHLDLSLTEWVVLSLISEGPTHGFALAKNLSRTTPLGQVWTVPRPLVYRALGRVEAQGLISPVGEEPGEPGPPRTIYKITPKGRRAVEEWRTQPVQHLREVRSAFLAKVLLTERVGRSPEALVRAQREQFAPLLDSLEQQFEQGEGERVITAWRYESSQAVARLLDRL